MLGGLAASHPAMSGIVGAGALLGIGTTKDLATITAAAAAVAAARQREELQQGEEKLQEKLDATSSSGEDHPHQGEVEDSGVCESPRSASDGGDSSQCTEVSMHVLEAFSDAGGSDGAGNGATSSRASSASLGSLYASSLGSLYGDDDNSQKGAESPPAAANSSPEEDVEEERSRGEAGAEGGGESASSSSRGGDEEQGPDAPRANEHCPVLNMENLAAHNARLNASKSDVTYLPKEVLKQKCIEQLRKCQAVDVAGGPCSRAAVAGLAPAVEEHLHLLLPADPDIETIVAGLNGTSAPPVNGTNAPPVNGTNASSDDHSFTTLAAVKRSSTDSLPPAEGAGAVTASGSEVESRGESPVKDPVDLPCGTVLSPHPERREVLYRVME